MTTSVGALSFAPLTATEGSLGVSVRVGDTLEATEFTFTNIQEAEWPAGGEYWLRLRVIEDGTAIGFIAPMADRKVVVDVGPLQMLLDETPPLRVPWTFRWSGRWLTARRTTQTLSN